VCAGKRVVHGPQHRHDELRQLLLQRIRVPENALLHAVDALQGNVQLKGLAMHTTLHITRRCQSDVTSRLTSPHLTSPPICQTPPTRLHCLPDVYCPLPTVRCPLPTAHCPPPTAGDAPARRGPEQPGRVVRVVAVLVLPAHVRPQRRVRAHPGRVPRDGRGAAGHAGKVPYRTRPYRTGRRVTPCHVMSRHVMLCYVT
jgi:hypothetical protein